MFFSSSKKVKNEPFIANILDKYFRIASAGIETPRPSPAGDIGLATGIPSSTEEGRLIFKFNADT